MYVKMLDGRFAGEVKDLRPDVALEFIRQGRAERAFQDVPPAPVIADVARTVDPFGLVEDPPVRGPRPASAKHKRQR